MNVDRFGTLLYGIGEAAGYLAIPPSTLTTWAYGYERRRAGARTASTKPIVTAVRPEHAGDPAMPFIGLAEAYALAAFRHAGVPMQRVRPAIDVLAQELGLEYALASRRLYTDGAEVLYDYARHAGDTPEGESARELVVIRNNQRVFTEVVELYLRRIEFAADGWDVITLAEHYGIPADEQAEMAQCFITNKVTILAATIEPGPVYLLGTEGPYLPAPCIVLTRLRKMARADVRVLAGKGFAARGLAVGRLEA